MRRHVAASSAGSTLDRGDSPGSIAQYLRGPGASDGASRSSAPSLRLFGLVLVAAALFFSFASSAFAARAYESQLTAANSTPFSNPFGLAVDSSDNLWVSDIGTTLVSKFDSTGSYLAQNNGTGSWSGSVYIQGLAYGTTANLVYAADSNFDDLWGLNPDTSYASVDLNTGLGGGCCFLRVAVDNSGNANDGDIYVSSNQSTVTRVDGTSAAVNFSASASYISANQLTGTPGHAFGDLRGVAVDAAGDVYVLDQGNSEVDQFDSTGTFVRAFTGSFSTISAVAVDPTNGDVLIGDVSQGVVHEFDSSGTFIADTDGSGTPDGSMSPQGLAVDSTGTLYVSDIAHPVVDVFGPPPVTHALGVSTTGTGAGGVTSSPAGIDCGATCSHGFNENSTVTLTAAADVGSTFTGWTVDGDANACPGTGTCDVPIGTADHTVVANFDLVPLHTLTASVVGSGSVTSSPAGINCGVDCTEDYLDGTPVTLTATPTANHHFVGWSGDCSGTSTCPLTMSADHTATATFAINTHAVNVSKAGTGSGTVTSDVGAINCGATCTDNYDHNTVVTLTANAAAGSTFAGWSGACSGTGTCQVTVTAVKNVTATFTIATHTLTVSKSGSGSVSSSPAGISCGADCSQAYNAGTAVTLTATAAAGSHFTGWSGACSGTGACHVTMSASRAVTATFATNPLPSSVLKLDATVAIVTGGKAAVKLSCDGQAACSDTLTLTAKVKVRKGRKTVTKTMTIGKASINIGAGDGITVKIKLNSAARKQLAKKHSLKATLTGTDLKHTIVLKQPKKKHKK